MGLRNIPDYEMSMRVKERTGLPMILDLSHTAGTVPNVARIAMESTEYDFDGIIIEVHPNPSVAWTDAKQQVTWKQFDEILNLCNATSGSSSASPAAARRLEPIAC